MKQIVPFLSVGLIVSSALADATDNYEYGRCLISKTGLGSEVLPVYAADSYLFNYRNGDRRYKEFSFDGGGAKVTLIKKPINGNVALAEGQWASATDYHYWPVAGYVGEDRFVMLVEKQGVKVRIQYLIEGIGADEREDGHCTTEHWKISFGNGTWRASNFAQPGIQADAASPRRLT